MDKDKLTRHADHIFYTFQQPKHMIQFIDLSSFSESEKAFLRESIEQMWNQLGDENDRNTHYVNVADKMSNAVSKVSLKNYKPLFNRMVEINRPRYSQEDRVGDEDALFIDRLMQAYQTMPREPRLRLTYGMIRALRKQWQSYLRYNKLPTLTRPNVNLPLPPNTRRQRGQGRRRGRSTRKQRLH